MSAQENEKISKDDLEDFSQNEKIYFEYLIIIYAEFLLYLNDKLTENTNETVEDSKTYNNSRYEIDMSSFRNYTNINENFNEILSITGPDNYNTDSFYGAKYVAEGGVKNDEDYASYIETFEFLTKNIEPSELELFNYWISLKKLDYKVDRNEKGRSMRCDKTNIKSEYHVKLCHANTLIRDYIGYVKTGLDTIIDHLLKNDAYVRKKLSSKKIAELGEQIKKLSIEQQTLLALIAVKNNREYRAYKFETDKTLKKMHVVSGIMDSSQILCIVPTSSLQSLSAVSYQIYQVIKNLGKKMFEMPNKDSLYRFNVYTECFVCDKPSNFTKCTITGFKFIVKYSGTVFKKISFIGLEFEVSVSSNGIITQIMVPSDNLCVMIDIYRTRTDLIFKSTTDPIFFSL
jgi:hypothetical protein